MMIKVEGANQTLRALRTLEPETARQVGREIKKAGDGIAAYIRGNAPSEPPMSGWREVAAMRGRTRGGAGWPAWAPIGASVSRRGSSVIISSTGASAAIFESAGAVNPRGVSSPHPDGEQFIRNISRYGRVVQSGKKKGRLARAAVKQLYPQTLRDVERACERATEAVNRRMP